MHKKHDVNRYKYVDFCVTAYLFAAYLLDVQGLVNYSLLWQILYFVHIFMNIILSMKFTFVYFM